MTPEQAKVSHAAHCNCKPVWLKIDTGQALSCGNERVLIWWPTVDLSQLDDNHQAALMVIAPMIYDDDGDGANDRLLKLGFSQVTPDNFSAAAQALKRDYEKSLWQDNVGKQLLGRIFDNDLGDDEKGGE